MGMRPGGAVVPQFAESESGHRVLSSYIDHTVVYRVALNCGDAAIDTSGLRHFLFQSLSDSCGVARRSSPRASQHRLYPPDSPQSWLGCGAAETLEISRSGAGVGTVSDRGQLRALALRGLHCGFGAVA